MLRRYLGSLLLLGAVVAIWTSCADQQPAINRVEAYALPKSLFTGEWYYGQTVVDVPGTKTMTTVGNTNYDGMYRIRWDIQENYLYARKSYELVDGAKNINPDTGEYLGTIVGAWKIFSQFDIKRSYNATTGEENNVIEENTTDHKWFDRKYLRVDWSNNLAPDYKFLDAQEGFSKEPLSFSEQDAHDPRWSPIFDARNGYIDVTSSLAVSPGFDWRYGYPLCWLFSGANAECSPEVIKLRHSFWRRDPNRDYEPRQHGGPQDEWFGVFVADRLKWDDHYGVTMKTKEKLINRHNIWVEHHDKNRPCAKDADCDTAGGSTCDLWVKFHKYDVVTDTDGDNLPDDFEQSFTKADGTPAGLDPKRADSNGNGILDRNDDADGNGVRDLEDFWKWDGKSMEYRCTIPMAKREPKPVVYYNSGYFPRSEVCDEDRTDPSKDKNVGPCNAWTWAKKDAQATSWSVLHKISNDYDETWWKVFLRGGYGWSQADYQKWITTHDPSQFTDDQKKILDQFGDEASGFYAFAICPNNPVQATDPWPCRFNHMSFRQAKELMGQGRQFGEVDENGKERAPAPRHGDVRYSFVNFVKDYYDGWALLGLGPSMTDPVTGENLAGVANVYVLNDWAATYTQEMVQLLNGSISPTAFIDGVNLQKWIDKVAVKNTAQDAAYQVVSPAQLQAMYASMEQPWMKKVAKLGSSAAFDSMTDELGNPLDNHALKRQLHLMANRAGLFNPAQRQGPGIEALIGTPLETKLVNDEILMAAGFAPGTVSSVSKAVLDKASPPRSTSFANLAKASEKLRWDLAHNRQMDQLAMADDAMVGLAYRLKNEADPQKIWAKARDIIMRAVLTHEMGHTMGLHHNWAGSEDVNNFFPEYWRMRTNNGQDTALCNAKNPQPGQLCPFFIKPINEFQLGRDATAVSQGLHAMYEYAYSSVMDYAGRYTIDGNGLGRYDTAAILYAHADKVEVYTDPDPLKKNLPFSIFFEWYDTQGNPLQIWSNRAQSFHYTNWYSQMGPGSFDESNRKLVNYRDIKSVTVGGQTGEGVTENGKVLPRVPYLFCTYTRGDISDGCNTRDSGSDQYERMKMHVDGWDTWYVMRSFTRYEFGISPETYWERQMHRSYGRLKDFNDTYALYQGLFHQWYDQAAIDAFFTDPINGWGAYTVAMHDAFNMALRTLAMPDIKGFKAKAPEADGQMIYSETVWSNENLFNTNLVNGRYFTTAWNDTSGSRSCGLQWWDCLHHIGFYLDKIMAIFALTDSQTYFVARDTAEDIREWRISFFDNFSTQLVDFFGGMLAEEYDRIAPWFDESKPKDQTTVDAKGVKWQNGMAWRDYATPLLDPAKPAASGAAVEAATRFTLQVYAALYGMLLFQTNFDNEFVERARLWKKGKGTTWQIKPTETIDGVAEFDDPFTGTTYVGVAYKDKRGIAQRMIAHANAFKARTKYCSAAATPPPPDQCISVSGPDQTLAETKLYQYRQLMDIVLQVTTLYDNFGWNWSWDPMNP